MKTALACSTCGKPSDGWPDSTTNKDGELCQECWEAECDKSWWEMMIALQPPVSKEGG